MGSVLAISFSVCFIADSMVLQRLEKSFPIMIGRIEMDFMSNSYR